MRTAGAAWGEVHGGRPEVRRLLRLSARQARYGVGIGVGALGVCCVSVCVCTSSG